jgi:hypothetical protein
VSELQRFPYKFESADGARTYTFPLALYEAESLVPLRGQMQELVGANGGHDFYGSAVWPKGPATHAVRFAVAGSLTPQALDTTIDALRGVLYESGLGKLFTKDADGVERWIWARITQLPPRMVSGLSWKAQSIGLDFVSPDPTWKGAALSGLTTDVTVGQSPKTVTWTNPGNARARVVITAQALASAGYSAGFTIRNSTLAQQIATTRASASTSSRVEIDGNKQSIRYSTDAGATWIDDYASATVPDTQRDFAIDLAPGGNTIVLTVGGTPNVRISAAGYEAWH